MFARYITNCDVLQLPFSERLYFISVNGSVLDNKLNEIPQSFQDDERGVLISWIDGYKFYKTSFLVAITFKPVKIFFKNWYKLSVLFKDDDKLNLHPSNLVWKFPVAGIESNKHKGFFHIPCYTNYLVNKQGIVIQQISGNAVKGCVHTKGYHYFTLSPDIVKHKSSSIGRHRILASVFLDYSKEVDDMEVNHRNGLPGDDVLNNLEWVTKKENIRHAFQNGLRSDNKTVVVQNHNTGEISKYFSVHECERALGLSRSVVHYRIKNSPGKVFPSGLSFEFDKTSLVNHRPKKPSIKVSVRNILTNEIQVFNSICSAANFTKISKKTISRKLFYTGECVFKGFVVKNV